MGKVTRVRSGCWTCKRRRRKCDEAKPFCNNCIRTNRKCEGYGIRLKFDVNNAKKFVPKVQGKGREAEETALDQSTRLSPDSLSTESIEEVEPTLNARELSKEGMYSTISSDKENNVPFEDGRISDFKVRDSVSSNQDLQKLSSELFEGLEYLLNTLDFDLKSEEQIGRPTAPSEILRKMDNATNFDNSERTTKSLAEPTGIEKDLFDIAERYNRGPLPKNGSLSTNGETEPALSYNEENMVLKHFFQKLLPLLDAQPNSPWPHLALKYCDFDVARSCFLSLACIHIYESRKGGEEYYNKGVAYINRTMDFLIRYISSTDIKNDELNARAEDFDSLNRRRISMFVILVLINVHILFAVLDRGQSSLSRYFFKVYATICNDTDFYSDLLANERKRTLAVVLSWYDTISAVVSPDCRLPYCNPDWYGTASDISSTLKVMGCPGEIFKALSKICFMRHEIRHGNLDDSIAVQYNEVKQELLNYRDFVPYEPDAPKYALQLKGAQCWALAVLVTLVKVVKPPSYKHLILKYVDEFIDTYGSMDSNSPIVVQMVWPIYAMGCECTTSYEKSMLCKFMDTLYGNAQMGTLDFLRNIVFQVWEHKVPQEIILERVLPKGVDYLPL